MPAKKEQETWVDRENKIEMKKLREVMERLAGDNIQDDPIYI
tara:strand:+ start:213 stop:338 length:126 start_codon:yes stop_codon:yes gene_type:complete